MMTTPRKRPPSPTPEAQSGSASEDKVSPLGLGRQGFPWVIPSLFVKILTFMGHRLLISAGLAALGRALNLLADEREAALNALQAQLSTLCGAGLLRVVREAA